MSGLYDRLGVARDADLPKIKRAYRALAKTMHPDTGGEPEAWRLVQEAYDVLKDAAARARYDETGEMPRAEAMDPVRDMALQIIGATLDKVMQRKDCDHIDVLAQMKEDLRTGLETAKMGIAGLSEHLPRVERTVARFRAKGEETTLLTMAQANLAKLKATVEALKQSDAACTMAAEILDLYGFDFVRQIQAPRDAFDQAMESFFTMNLGPRTNRGGF